MMMGLEKEELGLLVKVVFVLSKQKGSGLRSVCLFYDFKDKAFSSCLWLC